MRTLAITGRIGSGKSSALQICKSLGAHIIDCDAIVAQLLEEPQIIEEIQRSILTDSISGATISKKILAEVVFSDTSKLKQLEAILDPYVEAALYEDAARAKQGGFLWFVAEILRPGAVSFGFNYVLEIKAPQQLRKSRVKSSDLIQRDRSFPLTQADEVINNTGTLEDLKSQLSKLLK